MPHRRLDRERMFQQRPRFRVFVEQFPSFVSVHPQSVGKTAKQSKPRLVKRSWLTG
jgi:hypothetical protein